MDRIAAGIAIALFALALSGGFLRDVMAAETGAAATPPTVVFHPSTAIGQRSGRVLSLILALEALRTAPANIDRSKV
mgnify:CR=1 FL=1